MPGQIERDDPVVARDRFVAHEMAELARVGARRVQAQQRDARAGLLEIDPALLAQDGHADIAPDDRFQGGRCHHAPAVRGSVSTSLKYCRWARNGCRLPSKDISPRLDSAKMSCQPGGGGSCHSAAQA